MEWELDDEGQRQGPLTEEAIIEAIRGGVVKRTAKVRPVGKEVWKEIERHDPFARAFTEVAAAAPKAPPAPMPQGGGGGGGGAGWVVIRSLVWIGMVVWAGYTFLSYSVSISTARGAPQEAARGLAMAASAADAAVRLIFAYILARAVDKLGAISMRETRAQQRSR